MRMLQNHTANHIHPTSQHSVPQNIDTEALVHRSCTHWRCFKVVFETGPPDGGACTQLRHETRTFRVNLMACSGGSCTKTRDPAFQKICTALAQIQACNAMNCSVWRMRRTRPCRLQGTTLLALHGASPSVGTAVVVPPGQILPPIVKTAAAQACNRVSLCLLDRGAEGRHFVKEAIGRSPQKTVLPVDRTQLQTRNGIVWKHPTYFRRPPNRSVLFTKKSSGTARLK